MEEWCAIDLHMHTSKGITKNKKNDEVNFSYVLLQKAVERHNIKLMAVTNHNIIDMVNYILMRSLVRYQNSRILMGVELDTKLSIETPIHIVTIFEEKFEENYKAMKEINRITNSKIDDEEVSYTCNEIVEILGKYNVIMIPHGNKDKGVFKNANEEQIMEALKKVREGFIRIFDSPSDWKLTKIKEFLSELGEKNLDEFGGVLFSDVRDWSKYEERYRNFYMNAEPTFKGILHSMSNPTERFKPYSEIRKNNNYISKIVFRKKNDKSRIEDGEIRLSSGYNCVIGKSGSGKSLLLHLIKKKLLRDSEENANYSFSDNTEVKIFNEEGRELDATMINLGIGENLYNKIISASSTDDNYDLYAVISLLNNKFEKEEKFKKFKEEYNSRVKEYVLLVDELGKLNQELIMNKNKLIDDIKKLNELKETKIFDIKQCNTDFNGKYTETNITEFSGSNEKIKELREKVKIYKGKYTTDITQLIERLNVKLNLAKFDMISTYQNDNLKIFKEKIISNSIEKINESKSTKAKEKSKLIKLIPEEREKIVQLVLKIKLKKTIRKNMDLSIDKENINSEKEINKNVIVIESLANDMLMNVNERENELFNTNKYKTKLDKNNNYNMTNRKEAQKLIDKYISIGLLKNDKNIISENLKLNIQIKFNGQDVKKMNPGSIAKKYIEIYFDEQIKNGKNNVVIFDQIENDVDKEFINEVIKGLIGETKGHVQLIIVTHDPIVAVNADPNNYIESKKNDKNRFRYRNFVPESYERDELKTIACNVDGSKEVIKRRYEIYEGDTIYEN